MAGAIQFVCDSAAEVAVAGAAKKCGAEKIARSVAYHARRQIAAVARGSGEVMQHGRSSESIKPGDRPETVFTAVTHDNVDSSRRVDRQFADRTRTIAIFQAVYSYIAGLVDPEDRSDPIIATS